MHPQKWGLPFTSYFFILTLNLILFLVERGSSINTTNFFFLALTGFFGVVVLSLAVVCHLQWQLQPTPVGFFGLPHHESASAQPLASYFETGSLCFSCKDSLTVYEGVGPF
jgi:TctA family transporter